MRKTAKSLFLLILFLSTVKAFSQSELTSGYYVVVAAYDETREDYAKRFTEQLKSKGHHAQYGFNSTRNLFYVYLDYFTKLKPSLENMMGVRGKGEFTDAWVRIVSVSGTITSKPHGEQQPPQERPAVDSIAVRAEPVAVQPKAEPPKQEPTKTVTETKPVEQAAAPAATVAATNPEPEADVPEEPREEIKQYKQMTLGNTEVFLSLFFGTKNRVVEGEVQVIDADRGRFISKVKGNDYLVLPDPKSTSGSLTLTCDVFGYRKIQHDINYKVPLADTVKDFIDLMGTTIVVAFDLVRYQKGDINTLYNVYFYNDAAIMLPESKFELTSLLEMMQDNPETRIILHGHSNGNYHGKILSLGPEKNFFTMEGAVQGMGTAKDLSQQRAGTIREYLVMNGISGDRIEVKAWGGKKPLYDKHSVNAKKNVRVEVEVVQ